MATDERTLETHEHSSSSEPSTPRSRRALLTAAAAAGGALATQALVRPSPVSAADVVLGAVNTATAATTIRNAQALNSAKAIVGLVTTAIAGPSTAGVQGQSNAANGNGVFGVAMSGPLAKGAWGRSANGFGVYGEATATTGANYGVRGITPSTSGVGVHGIASATAGSTNGVYGQVASPGGRGVAGANTGANGTGMFGVANNGSGATGVWGSSATGRGVYGVAMGNGSSVGVHGESKSDNPFAAGVVAISPNGYGVYGRTVGADGRAVFGLSYGTGGIGVYGSAESQTGVNFGVQGRTSSPNGFGVYGEGGPTSGPVVGVRGITSSPAGFGVQGIALTASGTGVYGETKSLSSGSAGLFFGNVDIIGSLTKAGGSFLIDHPQDPANRTLEHSFVEAPERLNVYRGSVTLNSRGTATVRLPRYHEALNRDHHILLTPVGAPLQPLHVAKEVTDGRFAIAGGNPGQKVYWQVTGARQDAWAMKHPLRVERAKKRKDRGKYLNPELFGQPRSASLHPLPEVRRGRRLRRRPGKAA